MSKPQPAELRSSVPIVEFSFTFLRILRDCVISLPLTIEKLSIGQYWGSALTEQTLVTWLASAEWSATQLAKATRPAAYIQRPQIIARARGSRSSTSRAGSLICLKSALRTTVLRFDS